MNAAVIFLAGFAAAAVALSTLAVVAMRGARVHQRAARLLRERAHSAARHSTALQAELDRSRRSETDLRESADFSRALFAAAHAGLAVVDQRTGQIMDANQTTAAIVGLPMDDLVGAVAVDRLGVLAAGEAGGGCGAALQRETVKVETADGETRTCIRTTARLGPDDTPLVLVSLLDISDQKAVEEELREAYVRLEEQQSQMVQSEKLASIGQLAAGVAHEINNPVGYVTSNLTTVREYIEVMRTALELYEKLSIHPEDRALRAALARVKETEDLDFLLGDLDGLLAESLEGVTRVTEIVQGLKSFARQDGDGMSYHDVNNLVESMVRMCWNELKYKCTVERSYGSLPTVRCHEGRIGQVVMNVLINAVQAIPESGGTITVGTELCGDMAVITIADTGCGMDAATREHIFDPFFTTKGVGKGTGLGLSISHGIVKDHGGSIEVDSETGRGTVFRILLPAESAPVDEADAEAETVDVIG